MEAHALLSIKSGSLQSTDFFNWYASTLSVTATVTTTSGPLKVHKQTRTLICYNFALYTYSCFLLLYYLQSKEEAHRSILCSLLHNVMQCIVAIPTYTRVLRYGTSSIRRFCGSSCSHHMIVTYCQVLYYIYSWLMCITYY